MYSPLVAAFTVATALSNSLPLPTSIVVGVAANADIGITNAQSANAATKVSAMRILLTAFLFHGLLNLGKSVCALVQIRQKDTNVQLVNIEQIHAKYVESNHCYCVWLSFRPFLFWQPGLLGCTCGIRRFRG